MPHRILVAIKGEIKTFYRNKSTIFWTLTFPIVLILLFGAIFSGSGGGVVDIHVQDLSDSSFSHQFIQTLKDTGSVKIINVSKEANLEDYIKNNSPYALLIIPPNFQNATINNSYNSTQIRVLTEPTSSASNLVNGLISGVTSQYNLILANGTNRITIKYNDIAGEKFGFIDFFLPGVIALTTMTTTIFWMVSVMTRYRTNGIFKKLTTTPITRYEWLAAQILWQLAVVIISVFIIMLVGFTVFNMHLTLTPLAIVVIILSSALFSSIGMIIARFIRDEESASTAANLVTFPMMFLSGIFFNLAMMPSFLQQIAKVLPLYYVGEALRNTMVYNNQNLALEQTNFVAILSLIFFAAGVVLSKWKED
ncbi:MAG: ABC transporter permease [Methanomassiliicoccales archaeon]